MLYDIECVALRYFNVFGPRQDPNSQYAAVVPLFVSALLRGGAPVIYGDGEQSRDFTYVGDVVNANVRAMDSEGVSGEVFNIACGRTTRVDLALETEAIKRLNAGIALCRERGDNGTREMLEEILKGEEEAAEETEETDTEEEAEEETEETDTEEEAEETGEEENASADEVEEETEA